MGRYKLVEVEAPTGYFLLEDDIYFKVEPAKVSLTDEAGTVLKTNQEMWTLELDAEGYTLTVKNDILYDLPSTGRSGIYWYMIAGTMLMMMATAITYKNRREEVLERINRR